MRQKINEVIKASKEFLKKENVREELQEMIIEQVRSGAISSSKDLVEFFKTLTMASSALQQVPFEVYKKLSNK